MPSYVLRECSDEHFIAVFDTSPFSFVRNLKKRETKALSESTPELIEFLCILDQLSLMKLCLSDAGEKLNATQVSPVRC